MDPTPSLLHASAVDPRSGSMALWRRARDGDLVRVSRGVYADRHEWERSPFEHRHLALARAVQERRPDVVFSHRTAALVWGLPLLGAPPARPEVLGLKVRGDLSTADVQFHRTVDPFEICEREGLRVTAFERTLLDVARTTDATVSVAMLDAALASGRMGLQGALQSRGADIGEGPSLPRAALFAHLDRLSARGRTRASRALTLADGRSGSVGESVSRVAMADIGIPVPELQIPFHDHKGLIGVVDFWWRDVGVVGEFDGVAKYVRDEFTLGRSAAEVVVDEKRREDRLRALGVRVVRWGWHEARRPGELRAILQHAGVVARRPRRRATTA